MIPVSIRDLLWSEVPGRQDGSSTTILSLMRVEHTSYRVEHVPPVSVNVPISSVGQEVEAATSVEDNR